MPIVRVFTILDVAMRYVVLLLLVSACGERPDRQRELAACQLISKSGDELARCLIMKYSWGADSAGPAKTRFQWILDSIRAEHEKQAAAVLTQEQVRLDSIAAVQEARHQKLDSIDREFWNCDGVYSVDYLQHGNQARRDSGRVVCLKARASALRRAGLPANALPTPEP